MGFKRYIVATQNSHRGFVEGNPTGPFRQKLWNRGGGWLEHTSTRRYRESLKEISRHNKTNSALYRASCESAAKLLWSNDEWLRFPNPVLRSDGATRRRIRHHDFLDRPPAAFVTAHPSMVINMYDEM
eukprot:GFKZ01002687.1.p1 GENE.GFKZ01002687.1~~GFKZ01002687.1.p1  ORF type:complete len:128 (-),score=0.62 GFKZ01002687.1:270-653(-)